MCIVKYRNDFEVALWLTLNRPTLNRPVSNRPTLNRPVSNRPTLNRQLFQRNLRYHRPMKRWLNQRSSPLAVCGWRCGMSHHRLAMMKHCCCASPFRESGFVGCQDMAKLRSAEDNFTICSGCSGPLLGPSWAPRLMIYRSRQNSKRERFSLSRFFYGVFLRCF